MKILTILVTLFAFPSLLWASEPSERDKQVTIKGEVVSRSDRNAVAFATIYLKDHKQYNCISDEQGVFELKAPLGQHTIIVSSVGFVGIEKLVDIDPSADLQLRFELDEQSLDADEVTVKGERASSRINKTAYNVQSITIDELKNTTASMTDVLSRMGGVNIREAGGLGSETVISINGFTGNHVKIFIDGVLLDGNNSSFTLSNIPANMAERIDLYSGVVPIEFGTDAIGGVINIITNKNLRQNSISLDASYSYGSFNTHSSYLNLSQVFKSGLTYSVNAYQNYSDNDYWIDNTVVKFTENPGWAPSADYSDKTVYRVQRFNDAYHNETAIAMIGVTNKSWADVLTLKVNYSQYHNQIQTGVVQDVVYGEKQRWGHSITPTLDFSKNDLFTSGLDLRFSANYSNGYTHNYDPATSSYSWSGESVTNSSLSQTDNELRNNSYNANLTAKYIMGESHEFVASNIFGSTSRIQRSIESGTTAYSDWDTPSKSLKNISGLSYRYQLSDRFDATAFGKYYWQLNEGVVLNSDGTTYSLTDRVNDQWGYGVAATYFITRGLQVKASFEKAYRLPTSTEIFGDGDLEVGTFELNPETSYNYNLNLTYSVNVGKHSIYVDGSLIYRDTRDYIKRSVSSSNSFLSSASYENHGKVETKGYTITARYTYDRLFSLGGTFNDLSARNAEKSLHGGTSYETLTYGLRIPNQPYMYANGDARVNFYRVFGDQDSFSVIYDLFYQHSFPLNWETIGYADTKSIVPSQLAHNIMINYSIMDGKYNFTLEAKNITDANLYDNYSLQKAGRAFYGKVRVSFNKIK